VPHFEKMLYDQAQLVLAYVEGAQASGDPFNLEVAEDTLLYVLREMTDIDGGFYCAEDADSIPPEQAERSGAHKSEGAFYLWRGDEVDGLLGEDSPVVKQRFGIEQNGNAPLDPQQEFTGKNLLYVARTVDELSEEFGKSPDDVVDILNRGRVAMFQHRLLRPRPERDDKILTAWNGLMIAAFARTARVLTTSADGGRAAADPYLKAARRAATFVRERMWNADTRQLLRRYRTGRADIDAYAEDYSGLIFGLLELFQADPEPMWLEWAIALQHRQDELFWDESAAGWFSTTGRDPNVLLRMKDDYDGAEPTASSMAVTNLLTLSHLIDQPVWIERIERTFAAFRERLEQLGRGVPMMAAAFSTYVAGVQQIVVIEGQRGGGSDVEQVLATRSVHRRDDRDRWPDIGVRLPRPQLPGSGDRNRRSRGSTGIMKIPVDVWLRGTDVAQTISFDGPPRPPAEWTDEDVRLVLAEMLRAMKRQKDPGGDESAIALRSLSWIVNPYEEGGVVIAIEITMGAAIAGPFDADQASLEALIVRALAPRVAPASTRVH
jgi:uncharacterized protein YyaL (SSP411 family)